MPKIQTRKLSQGELAHNARLAKLEAVRQSKMRSDSRRNGMTIIKPKLTEYGSVWTNDNV